MAKHFCGLSWDRMIAKGREARPGEEGLEFLQNAGGRFRALAELVEAACRS